MLQFFQPPVFPDETKTNSARLLYGFALTSVILMDLLLLMVMIVLPDRIMRWMVAIIACTASTLLVLWVVRRGHILLGGFLTSAAYYVICVVLSTSGSGIFSPVIVFFPITVLVAGLIFGTVGGMIMAAISSVTILGLVIAGNAGWIDENTQRYTTYVYMVADIIGSILVIALQSQATRIINTSYQKSRESERQLSTLMGNLPGMAYRSEGEAGRMVFVSEGCRELTGYQREELESGKKISFLELIHREDRQAVLQAIRLAAEADQPYEVTYRIRTAQGDTKWVWEKGRRVPGKSEYTFAYEGFIADVSDRKHAEESLQHRAAQLDLLNQVGSRISSLLDVTELLNRTAQLVHEAFGYNHVGIFLKAEESEELLMKARAGEFTSAFPANHKLRIDSGMVGWVARNRHYRNAADVLLDPFFVSLDPTKIYTRSELSVPIVYSDRLLGVLDIQSPATGAFDDDDVLMMETLASQLAVALENARLFQSARQELEERRRTETLLRESEIRYREFVANTTEGIWRLEPKSPIGIRLPEKEQFDVLRDCVVEECNDAMARMIGHSSASEVIGLSLKEVLGSGYENSDEFLELFVQSGYRVDGLEFPETDRNGAMRWFESSLVGLVEDGNLTRAWGIRNEITTRRQRETELHAISSLSAAMRTASTCSEILPVVIQQLRAMFQSQNLTVELIDPVSGDAVVESAYGGWSSLTGARIRSDEGLNVVIRSTGKPYIDNQVRKNAKLFRPENLGECEAVAGAPLIARGKIIGFLWMGRRKEFEEQEVRLLSSVADIAANAIHRATLFEQIERNLQRMAALHEIDSAISGTLDLQVSLSILIGHLLRQMNIDAADILVLNPSIKMLEYSTGHGFLAVKPDRARTRIGERFAGRAALERRMVAIPNLTEYENDPFAVKMQREEGFVTYHAVPLLAKGQVQGVLEVYHRAQFHADQEWIDFLDTIAGQAAIAIDNSRMLQELQHANIDLQLAYDETIEGWSRALDLRDKETEGHTQRVTAMTTRLAEELAIHETEMIQIRRGALLHDIGKMGIPDAILLKPGNLSDDEMAIIRQHPKFAYDLLSPIRYLRTAVDIPYCHHEKWDGSGYPRGLKGEAIPLSARLFAIVDVWDAITAKRPYGKRKQNGEAVEFIRSQSGMHFDPHLVEVFLKLVEANDPAFQQADQAVESNKQ